MVSETGMPAQTREGYPAGATSMYQAAAMKQASTAAAHAKLLGKAGGAKVGGTRVGGATNRLQVPAPPSGAPNASTLAGQYKDLARLTATANENAKLEGGFRKKKSRRTRKNRKRKKKSKSKRRKMRQF